MENITKGPNIVFCKICGAMLTWEHPDNDQIPQDAPRLA